MEAELDNPLSVNVISSAPTILRKLSTLFPPLNRKATPDIILRHHSFCAVVLPMTVLFFMRMRTLRYTTFTRQALNPDLRLAPYAIEEEPNLPFVLKLPRVVSHLAIRDRNCIVFISGCFHLGFTCFHCFFQNKNRHFGTFFPGIRDEVTAIQSDR